MVATLIAGSFATGQVKLAGIPATGGNCQVTLNAAGVITAAVKLPLVDPFTGSTIDLLDTIQPGLSFLGYVQDGQLVNAGPIWTWTWDDDSATLTLNAAGAASYFDHRFVLPLLTDTDPTSLPVGQTVAFSGLSYNTIAKRLVQQAQLATNGMFPLDLEADVAGTFQQSWPAEQMTALGDALTSMTTNLNGVDVQFVPYFSSPDHVRWQMITGSTSTGELTWGADLVFDQTAAVRSITGLSITRDASSLATDVFEVGGTNTTEVTNADGSTTSTDTTVMSKSHDTVLESDGYLRLEASESRSTVTDQPTLQGYSDAAVLAGRFPTDTWSFKARLGIPPSVPSYGPGAYAQIRTRGHAYLGTGTNRVRILTYALTLGDPYVTVTCAPQRPTS